MQNGFIIGTLLLTLVATMSLGSKVPTILLRNAAKPNLYMPVVGLGTFGYGKPGNVDGEYWDNAMGKNATTKWLDLGARRIDSAFSYKTQVGVGEAIKASGVNRHDLFITSKIPSAGYEATLNNFDKVLSNLQTDYVDLLLIHWPGPCSNHSLSPRECRQDTWKAIVHLFEKNKTRAIGVSNFEKNHIEDILDLKMNVPALNQFEYHPYWHEDDLVAYCHGLNISVQTYSPLGAPDHMAFHKDKWPVLVPNQPEILPIAEKYNKTVAQVVFRWALDKNLTINPRTFRKEHMEENLNLFDFSLTRDEHHTLETLPNQPKKGENKVCPDPHNIP